MPIDMCEAPRQPWQRFWPSEFTQKRSYNRQEENKPYIEWLYLIDDLSWTSPEKGAEERGDKTGDEDDDEGQEKSNENEEDPTPELEVDKGGGGGSNVRTFMKGADRDDELFEHDQVEQVAGFCEHAVSENDKPVALLDDRNNSGNIDAGSGCSRPYLGPLTSHQLHHELSKQVILSILHACSSLTLLTAPQCPHEST